MELFDIYSAMLRLRSQFDVFTLGQETLSVNGVGKKIQLNRNNHNITLIGNFGLTIMTIDPNFQHTGKWHEFFSGNELTVSDVNTTLLLNSGEFRLYSDQKLPAFKDLATSISENATHSTIKIYPNPVTDYIQINSKDLIRAIELYSIDGEMIKKAYNNANSLYMRLGNIDPGMYFLRILTSDHFITEKIIKE
jgi:hypothetical protein